MKHVKNLFEEHSNKFKKQTRKVQTQKSSDLDLAHKRTNDVKQQSANTQQAVPDTILINKIELKELLSEIIGNTEFPMSKTNGQGEPQTDRPMQAVLKDRIDFGITVENLVILPENDIVIQTE